MFDSRYLKNIHIIHILDQIKNFDYTQNLNNFVELIN